MSIPAISNARAYSYKAAPIQFCGEKEQQVSEAPISEKKKHTGLGKKIAAWTAGTLAAVAAGIGISHNISNKKNFNEFHREMLNYADESMTKALECNFWLSSAQRWDYQASKSCEFWDKVAHMDLMRFNPRFKYENPSELKTVITEYIDSNVRPIEALRKVFDPAYPAYLGFSEKLRNKLLSKMPSKLKQAIIDEKWVEASELYQELVKKLPEKLGDLNPKQLSKILSMIKKCI